MKKKMGIWFIICAALTMHVPTTHTRCKKVKNLLVKCALQVCGNIRSCGSIIGSNTGNLLAYGSFYNNQTGQPINTGDLMPFTTDSVPPVGMDHGAAPFTAIIIQETGIYVMMFQVRANFGGGAPPTVIAQFFVNGIAVPGADDGGISASFITTLATLQAGDIVTIKSTGDPLIIGTVPNTTSLACELMRIA
jgi:hypothetical protein